MNVKTPLKRVVNRCTPRKLPVARTALTVALAASCTFGVCLPGIAQDSDAFARQVNPGNGRDVKVMIISMFGPEGQVWLDNLGPWKAIKVPGLSPDYPEVHCNRHDVCVLTTGMGHAMQRLR